MLNGTLCSDSNDRNAKKSIVLMILINKGDARAAEGVAGNY